MATVGDRRARSEVAVAGMDQPFVWSFRNHVESVLSKTGCNSGACHGAFAGKKGFKLSLRGLRRPGRLCHPHPPGPRPPGGAGRSGPQPAADQADRHDSAQGGSPLRRRFARISGDLRVDRGRCPGPDRRRRPADRAAGTAARQIAASSRRQATTDRAGALSPTGTSKTSPAGRNTRRPTSRSATVDPDGLVTITRLGRGGDQRLVFEPEHDRHAQRSLSGGAFRPKCSPRLRGATSSTNCRWPNWKA